jgi:hypothetical protein
VRREGRRWGGGGGGNVCCGVSPSDHKVDDHISQDIFRELSVFWRDPVRGTKRGKREEG